MCNHDIVRVLLESLVDEDEASVTTLCVPESFSIKRLVSPLLSGITPPLRILWTRISNTSHLVDSVDHLGTTSDWGLCTFAAIRESSEAQIRLCY